MPSFLLGTGSLLVRVVQGRFPGDGVSQRLLVFMPQIDCSGEESPVSCGQDVVYMSAVCDSHVACIFNLFVYAHFLVINLCIWKLKVYFSLYYSLLLYICLYIPLVYTFFK